SLQARRAFRNQGRLSELAALATSSPQIESSPSEAWFAGEALLALNREKEALELAAKVSKTLPRSFVGASLLFHQAQLQGRTQAARALAKERLALPDAAGYGWGRTPLDWVLLGQLQLAAGADAKSVLQTCFERALKDDPACEEAFEAIAELALAKGDAELAATKAREGLRKSPSNPRLHALLGEALEWSDRTEALASWQRALEIHPDEPSALCALAEHAFRLENAPHFDALLAKLPQGHPGAKALQLANALCRSDTPRATALRSQAAAAPEILHRAGALLSARYRFEEGAALQREALASDPAHLPAKKALADDLLRLGSAAEAWPLIEEIHQKDGYDVAAFNLLELKDRIAHFTKLESPHFEVWMSPKEAPVYGERVCQLLERAHDSLQKRYRFALLGRTRVEIFPDQKDFAVRTFGVPGGDGFLGVCFGRVITAPSPDAPRAKGHSWEATLWHEFTHTVTLTMTRNRMPRWLSEGISVYEEQQANPAWGRRFHPRYVPRLLGKGLTPLESMADAFRSGDPADLDFAYLQAGLWIEWLVQQKGLPTLQSVLREIGEGRDCLQSLLKHYGPLPQLNQNFAQFAAQWARSLAGTFAWKSAPAPPNANTPSPTTDSAPTYEESLAEARKAVQSRKADRAQSLLEELVQRAPAVAHEDGAYSLLAKVYRSQYAPDKELALWEKALSHNADLAEAYERLPLLYTQLELWPGLADFSQRMLGVHPMSLANLEALWKSNAALGLPAPAADACKRALVLDPANAPRWNARIGLLLEHSDPAAAKTHLLLALESNPRDRAALQALARLAQPPSGSSPSSP
ncbi:MAG: hypothetical protein RLZZ244_2707, partial [Verrucomicrobiota bacterium]